MITKAIQNCLHHAKSKGWDKTFWAFDIHGTIFRPTFKKGKISTEFYPFAKEVLQHLSKCQDIVMIMYTCSYPHEIEEYVEQFKKDSIHFHYVNANPEVAAGSYGYYADKFYFNVLFEDKAGFDPLTDWAEVRKLLATIHGPVSTGQNKEISNTL